MDANTQIANDLHLLTAPITVSVSLRARAHLSAACAFALLNNSVRLHRG